MKGRIQDMMDDHFHRQTAIYNYNKKMSFYNSNELSRPKYCGPNFSHPRVFGDLRAKLIVRVALKGIALAFDFL